METEAKTKTIRRTTHQGRSVKRLREILGIGQEALADQLHISQPAMSRYESEEEIGEKVLEKIAVALNIPVDLIKNFDDEATTSIIVNTFNSCSNPLGYVAVNQNIDNCTFNPVEKIMEMYDEKINLYKQLLQAEQEKVAVLQKLINNSK